MTTWTAVLRRTSAAALATVVGVVGCVGATGQASASVGHPATHSRARTEIVSWQHDGSSMPEHSTTHAPSVSSDGRFVAFASTARGLVPGQVDNGTFRIYVRDRLLGTNELVSRSLDGGFLDEDAFEPIISGDGRFVVYRSEAANISKVTRTASRTPSSTTAGWG